MSIQENNPLETPPIAFMIFNRPDYAQNIFNEIRKARPKKLFVVADGPRSPEEVLICEKTRAVIDQVDWDCEVYKNYAEKNMGLKERISSGITWFFEHVEAGIILEDDCLPHPSFFRFTAEMLEKYKDDERIMMISGDNFMPEIEIEDSYCFSKFFSIWGWATWRRAWKHYDISIKGWGDHKNKKLVKSIYHQKYMFDHMRSVFDEAHKGRLRTWDVQWLYACLISGGYCIIPRVNLISNIGIIGTHGGGSNQNLPTFDVYKGGFTHPLKITHCTEYDDAFYERDFKPKPQSILVRIRRNTVSTLVKYENIKKIYRLLVKIKNFVQTKYNDKIKLHK